MVNGQGTLAFIVPTKTGELRLERWPEIPITRPDLEFIRFHLQIK